MCLPCDTARELREAAAELRARCEERFGGVGCALKQVFKAEPLEDEWILLARRFNFD